MLQVTSMANPPTTTQSDVLIGVCDSTGFEISFGFTVSFLCIDMVELLTLPRRGTPDYI